MLAVPHEPSKLDKIPARDLTARAVAEAAIGGDELGRQIIQTSGRMLGRGLVLLIDCLNPELIIIGSLARRLGDLWLEPAMEVVRAEALPPAWQSCQVVPAGPGRLDRRPGRPGRRYPGRGKLGVSLQMPSHQLIQR
jgi:predicted NBD/HSP70 family sugar kinase